MNWWQGQGLRSKVALAIAATMVIMLGVVFVVISQYIRARLWQSEIQKTETINAVVKTLLTDAMLSGHKDQIDGTLASLGQSVGGQQLDSIAIYDDQNLLTAFASGFPGGPAIARDSMPKTINDPSCWGCHQLPPEQRPTQMIVFVDGKQVIRNVVPLKNEERCQSCHGTGRAVLGDSIVDFSQDQFLQSYTTIALGLGAGIILAVVLVALVLFQIMQRIILNPVQGLVGLTDAVIHGDLKRRADIRSRDEMGALGRAFNDMTAQLSDLIGGLERRVAERTKALATSADVSRRLSTILDQRELVAEVVEQVRSAFNYYHAHIYLLEPASGNLIMAGGTGEVGQKLLAQGHTVSKGKGLTGRAAETNRAVLVSDVTLDPQWLPNPLLPETKAEVAIPISTGKEVLGVLDVQHNEVAGLQQADVDLLQSIANQVAIALQNSRLYAQAEASAKEAQSLVDYAPEAIVVVDLETGLFADPNANAEKLYGLSHAELLKVGPGQMSPPTQPDGRDSTEKAMENIAEAMRGGAPVFEWIHRNAQGQDIPCEVRLVSIPGAKPRVRASVTDITERKRNEELTRVRAIQLKTVAEISTAAATLLDSEKLLQAVTNLTKERFDLYHAHVYLLDETASTLLLASGAGEIGKKMVAGGHSISMTAERSLVARAAREKKAVIVNDVRLEPSFLENPLLPETRAEMAVPLIVGEAVLGVLDVQSNQVDHFTQEDINIHTTLAAQIAIALQNTRTLSQARRQAERESMLNTIGQKIQSATTVEAVLQIAARELGHALGAPLTIAQLSLSEQNGSGGDGHNDGDG
jgi:PAS domain S-box-containing protein